MNTPSNPEEEIFEEAIKIESQAERDEFIKRVCSENQGLFRRVTALQGADEGESDFIPSKSSDDASLSDKSGMTADAGSMIGRYKLLEKIGDGGFGVVWAAEQKAPVRRRVALKIIKLGMDTQQVVARFEAERQALALMDHANIAKVFDAGATETGRPYFVMELVKGISITGYCDQEKLGTKERLDLFIKACHAIQHAHQKGIIHRDIKPSNIMVTLHDGVPVPKVIDFGIAKATQRELTEKTIYTQYSQFIGTPAYMSPEQAEMSGLDIDTRSDIYSMGVLLYELLTGSTPFDSVELMNSGLDEMRRIIREREPVRPSTKLSKTQVAAEAIRLDLKDEEGEKTGGSSRRPLPPIPLDLDWIVMKCLEKDRSRRYDSANGLAADLKRHLNDEPVSACPPTTAYRFQKAFRRNKLVFTAGAAVAAALLIGLSVSSWQTFAAWEAQRQTDLARLDAEQKQTEAETFGEEADKARKATEYANYVSQVRLAAVNLEQGNQRTAQDALLATVPGHRNWEWGHLVNKAWPPADNPDSWSVAVREPDDSVAAFWDKAMSRAIVPLNFYESVIEHPITSSKNGKRVFSSPGDGKIHVWGARTGVEMENFPVSDGFIISFAMSHADSFIAAGDTGGITRLVDVETHEILWTYSRQDRKPIHSVWFSPNDRYVVVGYFGGVIDVLDAKSGQSFPGFTRHDKEVTSLQFLSDGNGVITASRDGSVRVWELNTGREVGERKSTPYHGTKGISVQAINPNNLNEVATGDFDGALFLWNRVTGKKLALNFHKGIDEISHLSFSNDGSCLLVAEGEKRIRVLDRASGTELAVIRPESGFVRVALSQDNERILTAPLSGRPQIWAPVHPLSGLTDTLNQAHNDIVIYAAFSPDGSRIVTASYDKTVKVWDTATQELLIVFRKHTNELLKADFSPDGQRVVSVDSRGVSRVWDSRTGEEIFHQALSSDHFLKSAEAKNGLRGIFLQNAAGMSSNPFSPTANDPAVVLNSDQGLLVRRGVDGRDSLLLKESPKVAWPVIDPLGNLVAAITDVLDVIKVWDLNTGDLKYTLKGHKSVAFWAEFSGDGKRIVTGSTDKTAIVWDASDGAMLFPPLIGHKNFVSLARFSPDGERIATLGFDNEALIWNSRTGELLSTLKGAERRVTNLEFNPNLGVSRVLTTAADNIVRLWDPSGPVGRDVLQITRDSKLIHATWSPDGRLVLSCWKDGVVQLYKTIPMAAIAELSDADDMVDQVQQWRAIQN